MFDKKAVERFGKLETPFYYYDLSLLRKTIDLYTQELKKYGWHSHYALKANACGEILSIIEDYGMGADCVSGNEISLAIRSGFSPERIVYSGVGKSDKEIETALAGNIFSFNCESIPEIKVIDEISGNMGKTAPVSLRINPDIDAHTHKYINTGRSRDKFGISTWMLDEASSVIAGCRNIRLTGIQFHVGSQITDMNVFRMLAERVNTISAWYKDRGIRIENINLGGGIGIDYTDPEKNSIPDFKTYFSIIDKNLKREPWQQVRFEPGRAIVGQCGTLISKVLYVKVGKGKKFVIIDAGMNDLIRPALYQAHHKVENLTSVGRLIRYDVVGPVCESSDRFSKDILLPETGRGDIIAIRSAGAYGQVMAMRYNQKDIAPEYCSE